MKNSLITLPKIYADWSAIGWAMVLGHAPESSDTPPNGKPSLREVKQWEGEGGTLKETAQTAAARKAARKPAKRKPTPIKAPGKKRAPMKKKRTRR
jgi:hypothetical protein